VFSFLYSQEKKMRQNAANWLEVADRVYKFRRDQLTDIQNQQLLGSATAVKLRLKEKADVSKLKLAVETLEGVLRATGGRIYPQSSLVENIEFFLVAAIVLLGLRAYFIQPFKIPTNSMWPSYYGMTAEVFQPGEEPGVARQLARLLTLGASNYTVKAPADGEVMVPVFLYGRSAAVAFTQRHGRSLGVFPTVLREFTFMVGGEPAKVTVPADFQGEFEQVLDESFKGTAPSFYHVLQNALARRPELERSTLRDTSGAQPVERTVYWVPTGKRVKKGEPVMSFDILTGDLLFVERISYNFLQPKVGSGFVFKTGNIRSPEMQDVAGNQISQYYVKRLVGTPGDTLEIKAPALYRNGLPIEGADAFGKNARREGKYPGYTNGSGNPAAILDGTPGSDYTLPVGGSVTVPPNSYYALGDNSPRSKDSRYWGFVPEKDVVGRPLFIYFPLTRRWGPAR
jgi:signal peptidase I